MIIRCENCGSTIIKYDDTFKIRTEYNPILRTDVYTVELTYQTVCPNCGDLVYGIKRKQITINDIEKIMYRC